MKKVHEAIWKDLLPVSSAFTTAEVAAAADVHVANASRDLALLADRGLVVRIRRGLWVAPGHPEFSPYAVVPHLFDDPGGTDQAYVSVVSALSLHGMLDQIPRTIHVVVRRQRHSLPTPFGTYEFHRVSKMLFGGYEPYGRTAAFLLATPEKALFDTLYLSTRKGRRFAHLPEVELPSGFSSTLVEGWISRIEHERTATAVRRRWIEFSTASSSAPPPALAIPEGLP